MVNRRCHVVLLMLCCIGAVVFDGIGVEASKICFQQDHLMVANHAGFFVQEDNLADCKRVCEITKSCRAGQFYNGTDDKNCILMIDPFSFEDFWSNSVYDESANVTYFDKLQCGNNTCGEVDAEWSEWTQCNDTGGEETIQNIRVRVSNNELECEVPPVTTTVATTTMTKPTEMDNNATVTWSEWSICMTNSSDNEKSGYHIRTKVQTESCKVDETAASKISEATASGCLAIPVNDCAHVSIYQNGRHISSNRICNVRHFQTVEPFVSSLVADFGHSYSDMVEQSRRKLYPIGSKFYGNTSDAYVSALCGGQSPTGRRGSNGHYYPGYVFYPAGIYFGVNDNKPVRQLKLECSKSGMWHVHVAVGDSDKGLSFDQAGKCPCANCNCMWIDQACHKLRTLDTKGIPQVFCHTTTNTRYSSLSQAKRAMGRYFV